MKCQSKIILCFLCIWSVSVFAMRDPTRPPDAAVTQEIQKAEKPQFVLNAVLTSKRRRLAVINGIVLGLNDMIGSATVVKIERDTVDVKSGGGIITLPLFKQNTLSTART